MLCWDSAGKSMGKDKMRVFACKPNNDDDDDDDGDDDDDSNNTS